MTKDIVKDLLAKSNENISKNRSDLADNLKDIKKIKRVLKRRRSSWLEVTTGEKDKESRYEESSTDLNKTRTPTNWCTNTYARYPKTCDDYVQKSGLGPEISPYIEGGSGTWRDRSDPSHGSRGTIYGYREGAICIPWPQADSSSDNGNCQPGDKIIARSKQHQFTAAQKADYKKYADVRKASRSAAQKKADDARAAKIAIRAMKDNADINKARTGTKYCTSLFFNKDYAKCDDYVQYSGFTERVRAMNLKGAGISGHGYQQGHICEPFEDDAANSDTGDCRAADIKVIASSKRVIAPANVKTLFENVAIAQASAKGLVWDESSGRYIDKPVVTSNYDPASVDVNKTRTAASWCSNLYIAYDKCDDYVQYSGMTAAQASRIDAGGGTYRRPDGNRKGYEQGAICRPWDSGDSSSDGNCKPSGKVIAHAKAKQASSGWITNAGGDAGNPTGRPPAPPPAPTPTYTPTPDAAYEAQTLIEYARDVLAKADAENAALGCTVASSAARTCTNGGEGQSRFSACAQQANMWNDLNTNPILRHFVNAFYESCDEPPCGEPIMTTALKSKVYGSPTELNARLEGDAADSVPKFGIGWLKIPTTSTNNLFADWGTNKDSANHSYTTPLDKANGDYTIYGDEHLTLLIVRKFTRSESKKIFDALANQPAGKFSMRQPKHVKGYNFIFTKEGHISFIPSDGSAQVTYLNPVINSNDQTSDNTQEAGGKGQGRTSKSTGGKLQIKKEGQSYDQSNTMAGLGTNGTAKFNAGESYRNGMELVYAMNPKVVMNKSSTYILYTPADEEVLIGSDKAAAEAAIEESKYYLLYNPIHTLEFRRFYQSYLQSEVTSQAGSRYTEPHWNGFYNGLQVADPGGCRSLIPVPSMSTIFAKYCNAFQIKGLKNNSAFHYIKHYADPVCPYILSDDSSFQAFTTNTNTTHESTRNDYYKITSQSTNYGSWKSASTQFSNVRDNDAYNAVLWACPNHGVKSGSVDDNIQGWIKSNNWLGKNSQSFIKDVIIAEINKGNWQEDGKTKLSLNRIPDSGIDPQDQPECRFVEANFTSCAAVVYAAGDMTDNQIIQQQQCGIPGKAEVKSDDGKGTGAGISDDQKHPCHQLDKVPECPDYGTPGEDAAYITVSGVGEVYTGCCKLETDLLGDTNCLPPNGGKCEDGRTGGQVVDADGNVIDAAAASDSSSDDKLLLTKAFERVTARITKASDVALTSKLAYPTDLIIASKSDTLAEEAEKNMRASITLKGKIDTFGVSSVTYLELEADIGNLSLEVKETEKLSQEIVILIANNYLFGFKKMYVIGGGALLVFLIILIVLMKKK